MPHVRRQVPRRNPPPVPANPATVASIASTVLPTVVSRSRVPSRTITLHPTVVHRTVRTVLPLASTPRTIVPTVVPSVRRQPTVVVPPPVVPPRSGRVRRRPVGVPPNSGVPVVQEPRRHRRRVPAGR
jgi:hypothetical protein